MVQRRETSVLTLIYYHMQYNYNTNTGRCGKKKRKPLNLQAENVDKRGCRQKALALTTNHLIFFLLR